MKKKLMKVGMLLGLLMIISGAIYADDTGPKVCLRNGSGYVVRWHVTYADGTTNPANGGWDQFPTGNTHSLPTNNQIAVSVEIQGEYTGDEKWSTIFKDFQTAGTELKAIGLTWSASVYLTSDFCSPNS
jgi:hypothetical protein